MDSKSNNSYLKKMYEILSGKKVVGIYYSDNYYLKKISEYIKGGGDVTVDDHMDINSTNPVQNKVITRTIGDLDVPVKTSDLVNDGEDGSPFVDVDAVGDKEDKENKVSVWSGNPSDTNYPSEKLVKTDLDLKEDKSNKVTGWSSTPDNIHYPSEKLVKDSLDDLVVSVEQTPPEAGYASTYVVSQGGVALSPKINIPKDFLVKSVTTEICQEADVPIQGLEPGDKYIDFIINTVDSSETEQHLYLAVKEFGCVADEVTLTLVNGVMSIKAGGVDTAHLKDGSVTYAKLVSGLVVDNLTTDDSTKMLSAKQGKVLEDEKIDKVDIVDDLITDDSTKVLSAKQGKLLYDYIGNIEEDMLL